jgi:hypothetical protein
MATKPNSTARAAPSTIQTIAILCTPLWIILATVLYSLANGSLEL